MAVKIGNSWVSEEAYAYAKSKATEGNSGSSMLHQLSDKFPGLNFSMNTAPFQGKGTNNLAIAPNILQEMEEDPEKKLEYEALIYDCNNLQKSMANRKGLISFGFIINSDGTLGAWSISKSGSSTQRNQYQLDKKDKGSWLPQILEKMQSSKAKRKTTEKAARNSTGPVKKSSNEEYLRSLQKEVPYVKLGSGCGISTKPGGKAVVDVSPMLLEKMQNDPEAAKKYTQTLKDIERAEKTGDAYYNALGGVVERWSYWYVDENGKYYHFAYTRRDDKLNKKLREEAKKNAEDLIEKTRENSRKKKEQLAEKLEEMAEEADTAEETGTAKKALEISSTSRKTAADELSYLSDKYSGFSFVSADYAPGMRYGSNATTNIAISPEFLKKMANDPELEQEYESYFGGMQRLDEENIRTHEDRGRHIIAQGWAIDKDGGISRWGISEPTDKRHYGQETTDYINKLREQALEEKQDKAKLEEKRKARIEGPGKNIDMKI